MTIANVDGMTHIYMGDFFSLPVETDLEPMRHSVILYKSGAAFGDLTVGTVVTHMNLNDWCQLHGYNLVKLFPNSRVATPNERTDLF